MTKNAVIVSKETRAKIQSAAERLLAGAPVRSGSHELTATNLAREAGVGRATLNRAQDLRDAFVQRVAALRKQQTASHPQLVAERLRNELKSSEEQYRDEIRSLRELNQQLANQVQTLTLALQRYQKVLADQLPANVHSIAMIRPAAVRPEPE